MSEDQEGKGEAGVAMYIHQSLLTEVAIDSILEYVTCKVNETYLTVFSVYCPPDYMLIYDALFVLQDSLPQNKLI